MSSSRFPTRLSSKVASSLTPKRSSATRKTKPRWSDTPAPSNTSNVKRGKVPTMSNTLPTNVELIDTILNSDAIADSTRLATRRALNLARANGRDFPTPRDCIRAAVAEKATIGAVCGAWGYCRDQDKVGNWLNVRERYANPERDDYRRGVFQTNEALMMFMAFCTLCKVPLTFQFAYVQRRPPRRRK